MLPIPGSGAGLAALHAVEVAAQRLAAAGGLVGLAARDMRGCVGLFSPAHLHLSPARGALLAAAPCALANLHACAAVVDGAHWRRLASASPTAQLASALFHRHAPEEPPRGSQLRSLPAAYLDAPLIGHLTGLAQARACEAQIERALREHCGIAELARRSGVTIARFVRLAELVRAASEERDEYGMESALGAAPGMAVLLRLLWERARGRGCLLAYAAAVHAHAPAALSAGGRSAALEDGPARDAWVGAAAAAASGPPLRLSDAAAALAVGAPPSAELAEGLAARLLARVTHKPLVQQGRYGFRQQPARPDCVEACVRELVESLLYDPAAAALDSTRLPAGADPCLCAFLARREYASSDAGGQAWFDLCSARPGIAYLAGAGRDRYELAPELHVLTAVSALLLGLGAGCESAEELARRWNERSPRGPRLRGWATASSFVVQEVAWFELLPGAATGGDPDAGECGAPACPTIVIALRPNSNHAFARRPPAPLSPGLAALRAALLASAPAEWAWMLPALASGELLPAEGAQGCAEALDRATAARVLWADLVHARARLAALRAAARARGARSTALAPWLLEPLAAERDARLSVALARVLLESGWAADAHAVRACALRSPLLCLTLGLLRRDWPLLAAAWARARRDGESFAGACALLGSAIGVAWVPSE